MTLFRGDETAGSGGIGEEEKKKRGGSRARPSPSCGTTGENREAFTYQRSRHLVGRHDLAKVFDDQTEKKRSESEEVQS